MFELTDAGSGRFVGKCDLECLVEPLNFGLGLWVIWFAVFLRDSYVGEELLEAVA